MSNNCNEEKPQQEQAQTNRLLDIEKQFLREMRGFPEEMLRDLFFCYSNMDETELKAKLVHISELFNCDYNERDDPLENADWVAIRDLTAEYAHELDETILTYIMAKVVEKKAIH